MNNHVLSLLLHNFNNTATSKSNRNNRKNENVGALFSGLTDINMLIPT